MDSLFNWLDWLFHNAMSNGILGMAGLLFFTATIGGLIALMIIYGIELEQNAENKALDTKFYASNPTFCLRTSRKCIGGAFDGGDGFLLDCPAPSPETCEHRSDYADGNPVSFELEDANLRQVQKRFFDRKVT